MKNKLITLAKYKHWANSLIFEQIIQEKLADNQLVFWANHIINAEIIWMNRIQETPTNISPIELRPSEEILPLMHSTHQRLMEFVENSSEESLAQIISYKDSKGNSFKNELGDIILHVLNHSTHHRSQMAARIRELGYIPAPTDYIYYLRQ